MLAVFLAWLMFTSLLEIFTVFPGWFCAILAAVPFIVWYIKSPGDFQ